jgi:hypothetical protein
VGCTPFEFKQLNQEGMVYIQIPYWKSYQGVEGWNAYASASHGYPFGYG